MYSYVTILSSVGTWFDKAGLFRPDFNIYNSVQCKLEKIRGAPAPGATVVPTPMGFTKIQHVARTRKSCNTRF